MVPWKLSWNILTTDENIYHMKNIHLPFSEQRLRKLFHLFLDNVSLQSSSSFHDPFNWMISTLFILFFFSTRTAVCFKKPKLRLETSKLADNWETSTR